MTTPLWILAIGSIFVGFVGLPASMFPNLLEKALRGGIPHMEHPQASVFLELGLMALSLSLAVIGILWALNWYVKKEGAPAARTTAALGPLYRVVANRWFVDEIYWAWIIYPYRRSCTWLRNFDAWVIDGAVNGTAMGYRMWAQASHYFDKLVVDGAVNLIGLVSRICAWAARRLQTGLVENYMLFTVGGIFLLGGLYLCFVVL